MTIGGAGVGVSRRAAETEPGYTIDTFAGAQQKAFLEAYRKAPDVTRRRLYLETMERVVPKMGD